MAQHETTETKDKPSVWGIFGKIGKAFGFIFSIFTMILGLVVATPFFILVALLNWVKTFIGFALLWLLAVAIYSVIIMNSDGPELSTIYSNTNLLWLMGLSLVVAIMITVADMKD